MLGRFVGGWVVALVLTARASLADELTISQPVHVEPEPAFISTYGDNAELASSGSGWLLLYEDAGNTGWDTHLVVGRVSSNGAVAAPPREIAAPIRIGPAGLAFDGTGYVAAWGERATVEEALSIRTVRLDADGAPLGETVTVASSLQPNFEPAVRVASAGSSTLLVWPEVTASTSQARWVDVADGVVVATGAVEFSSTLRHLDVGFSGDAWLIAAGTDDGLLGFRVAASTGAAVDQTPFVIDDTNIYANYPSVAAADDGWAVAWKCNVGVRIARVASDSTPSVLPGAVMSPGTAFPYPKLVRAGDGFDLVAKVSHSDPADGEQVVLKRFSLALDSVGDPLELAGNAAYYFRATVAGYDGERLLVGWQEQANWFAARVNAAGEQLDTPPFPLTLQASPQLQPQAAFGFGRWLVSWADRRSGSGDIYARLVDPSGTPSGVGTFGIGKSSLEEESVALATGEDAWLAVWREELGDVHAARVDATGALLDTTPIVLGNCAGKPSVTFDGTYWAVAWEQRDDWYSLGTAVVVRIASDGSIVDSAPIAVSPVDDAEPYTVGVAMAGENYAVSWASVSGGYFLRELTPGGALVGGVPTTLLDSGKAARSPTLALEPNGGWLFWIDGGNYDLMFGAVGGPPQSIYDTSGGVGLLGLGGSALGVWRDDAGLQVGLAEGAGPMLPVLALPSADDLFSPTLAFDGQHTALLAYERSERIGGVLTSRIETRLMTGLVVGGAGSGAGGGGGTPADGGAGGDENAGNSGASGGDGGADPGGRDDGGGPPGGATGGDGGTVSRGGAVGTGGAAAQGGARTGNGGAAPVAGTSGARHGSGDGGGLAGETTAAGAPAGTGRRVRSGCSCDVGSDRNTPVGLGLMLLVVMGVSVRRRRLAACPP